VLVCGFLASEWGIDRSRDSSYEHFLLVAASFDFCSGFCWESVVFLWCPLMILFAFSFFVSSLAIFYMRLFRVRGVRYSLSSSI